MFEDSKKNSWVGSTKSLFVKAHTQSSFSTASLISLAEKPIVRYIAESPDSSIWLSTLGAGIIRMRDFKPDYVFKRFGLGTHVTRSITIDPRFSTDPNSYVLWVTTESRGIHRLNVQNDSVSIITITKENGLIDNTIHTIVFDDANNLWMTSNNGLNAVKSEDMDSFLAGSIPYLPTQNFYERDGLPSNEFNGGFQSTGFKSKSGLMYFANQKGLVSFNPATLIQDKSIAKVFIEDVYVNNKHFHVKSKKNNSLNLPSGIYDIKIFVSIIQPSSSHDQKLYYKVNNQQTEWLEINQGQPLNLSSLDWGTYSISIKSSLNLTVDSSITRFTVHVAPFWYQSISFYLFLASIGIALIYVIIKTRTQYVIRQNQDLEKLITRRSTELQIEQQKNLIASQKMISELTHKNNIIKSIHSLIQQPSKLLFESLTVWSTNYKEVLHDSSITSFNELISQSKSVSEKLDRSIKLLSNQHEEVEFSKEEINLNDLLHYVASSLKKKSISLQARSTFPFEDIGVFSVFDGVIVQTALVDLIEFVLRNENASVHATLSKAELYSTLTLEFSNVEHVIIDSIISHVSTNEKNNVLDSSTDIHYLSLLSSLKRVFENSIGIEGEKTSANTFQITFSFLTSYLGSSNRETNTQEKSFIKSIEEKNQQKFKIAIFDSSKNYSEIIERNVLPNCELEIMARNGIHGYAQTIAESDMILLDSNFTYGDPFNLIKTARNGLNGDKLTIVLMTTVFDAKEQHAALRIGADMYITKPLSNDALVAQIESLLSFRKRLLQSIESHTEQLKLPESGITRSDREFMERVLSVIKQNISNPDFTVESLSDIMKYNRTSLSKRIKKLVNRNPSSILQELRIVKAVELLQTNEYNISEVAYTC